MSDSRQFRSARAGIVEGVSQNSTITGGVAAFDDERRYQAAVSKDPRFDGVFFIAVTSTGIYCRPSCPAITPKRANMRFYRSAAAAQEAGFRACKRCRPDASPGSPEWNIRADVVGRAMRLISDGVVDRDGVEGLASRLGYEQRQVRRLVTAELGAGPRAIARVEEVRDGCYRRTINLPNGVGVLSLGPLVPSPAGRPAGRHGADRHGADRDPGYVECELQLEDLRDLTAAVQRCRRLLDLDADPEAVTGYLSSDPVLGPLALANPGRRSPGHVDGNELALRAVLGQQVSVAAARRLGARLVAAYGKPLSRPDGPLTHVFPEAGTLAAADPAALAMPRSRALALTGMASALA